MIDKSNSDGVDGDASDTQVSAFMEKYLASRREWLERYGDYIAQAKNWRLAALGSFVVSAVLAAGLVYEADRVHVVPYVVEVNKLGDAVRLAQEVTAGTYETPIVTHVLTHWIRLVRSRIPNVPAEKEQYNSSYYYISSKVQSALNAYYRRHNPYKDFSDKLGGRTVQIISALPLGKITKSGGTYQIQWTETQYAHSGAIQSESHWEGTISYIVTHPVNITVNPFGIYITSFSWNKMA